MIPKNVCIAFLGFDSDRIYLPVKKLKCDKLHLIIKSGEEHPNAIYNKSLILKNLKDIEVVEHKIPHDTLLRLNCIKKIVELEQANRVFVNVSTGSKLDAIAGMLGVMLFRTDALPFYAIPEGSGRFNGKKVGYSKTQGLRDIEQVPVLSIQKPDDTMIRALCEIKNAGGKIKKKELVKNLIRAGFIEEFEIDSIGNILRKKDNSRYGQERYRSVQSGAFHVCENRIFRPLKNRWNLITEDDKTKNRNIFLTEDGRKMVKIFFGE